MVRGDDEGMISGKGQSERLSRNIPVVDELELVGELKLEAVPEEVDEPELWLEVVVLVVVVVVVGADCVTVLTTDVVVPPDFTVVVLVVVVTTVELFPDWRFASSIKELATAAFSPCTASIAFLSSG